MGRPKADWRKPARTELLTVRLSPGMMERLQRQAAARETTMSQLIRDVITAMAVAVDSPGDLVRSVVLDPQTKRSRIVARDDPELPFDGASKSRPKRGARSTARPT